MKIFKYEMPITDNPLVEMPEGAKVLSFNTQNGVPCIWALVDPAAKKVVREFYIYGTGHKIYTDNRQILPDYIGTIVTMGGALVWHLFQRAQRG